MKRTDEIESLVIVRRRGRFTKNSKQISLADLCRELGVNTKNVNSRRFLGHSLYHALFGPPPREGKPNPNAEARRVADYMERYGQPISIGDACETVGVDRQHAGYTLTRMRVILGERLVFHSRSKAIARDGRPEALYTVTQVKGKKPPAEPRIYPPRTVPKDLWRGWINPATGIKPPRLGVDLPKRPSTTQA